MIEEGLRVFLANRTPEQMESIAAANTSIVEEARKNSVAIRAYVAMQKMARRWPERIDADPMEILRFISQSSPDMSRVLVRHYQWFYREIDDLKRYAATL